MIGHISKAIAQMTDPRFRHVLLLGLGLTVGLLFAFYIAVGWAVGLLVPDSLTLPLIGEVTWVSTLASGVSIVGAIFVSGFLMVPVASAFTGLFLDQVADAVEAKHYPGLPPARRIPLMETLADSARFLGILIGANAVALLIYLMFLPLAPFIFWALNGFLLGREYIQIVALRYMTEEEARALRRKHRGQIWLLGGLMAVPLSIPLVNLLVPVLGAASFTHLFHRLKS